MGSLKQSRMEYQKLFTVQTTTLRLKTVTPALVILKFFFAIHLHCLLFISLLLYRSTEIGDGSRIWGTVCVPLDVLLVLYFHVFSGLSVLLFLMYVQLRQNGPCARHPGAVPLPAAYLLARAVSPHNNVKDIKNGCLTRCILNNNNIYWFLMTLEKCSWALGLQIIEAGLSVNILFCSHMIVTQTRCVISD